MPKVGPRYANNMPNICQRYTKDITHFWTKSQKTLITANPKFLLMFFFYVVLAWSHPYGRYGIIKQGVFNVYPVSSPQAHVSKFSLNAVLVLDLIQG